MKKIIRLMALMLVLGSSFDIESRGGGGGGHGGGGGGRGGGGFHGGGARAGGARAGSFRGGGARAGNFRGARAGNRGGRGFGRGSGWGRGWNYGAWGSWGWGGWGYYGWYLPWIWSFTYPWYYYAANYGPTWYTTQVSVPEYEVDREQWTDERGSNYWEFYNDTNLSVTIKGPQGDTEIAPKSAEKVPHIGSFKFIALATDKDGKTHKITVNTSKHYMRILYKDGKMSIERS